MNKHIPAEGLTDAQRYRMMDLAAMAPLQPKPIDEELKAYGLVCLYDDDGPEMTVNYADWSDSTGNLTPYFNWLVYRESCDACKAVKRSAGDLDYVRRLDGQTRLSFKQSIKFAETKVKLDEARKAPCVCGAKQHRE